MPNASEGGRCDQNNGQHKKEREKPELFHSGKKVPPPPDCQARPTRSRLHIVHIGSLPAPMSPLDRQLRD